MNGETLCSSIISRTVGKLVCVMALAQGCRRCRLNLSGYSAPGALLCQVDRQGTRAPERRADSRASASAFFFLGSARRPGLKTPSHTRRRTLVYDGYEDNAGDSPTCLTQQKALIAVLCRRVSMLCLAQWPQGLLCHAAEAFCPMLKWGNLNLIRNVVCCSISSFIADTRNLHPSPEHALGTNLVPGPKFSEYQPKIICKQRPGTPSALVRATSLRPGLS